MNFDLDQDNLQEFLGDKHESEQTLSHALVAFTKSESVSL